ncbi:SDR family oxidoreductase [Mangrovimicrobium sediminis]|uniref:SDR family oxidoreductase n=1 Tax=Mangrovimicrobium sediminis TaxID=2562682 RepID=A0A4Z0LVY8_9GAMM|nr:SDR family NAD(P)-dependent oxidoreductase [Haliea sp. SAOS-164]TGD71347.1 SDR family oxidoreductase [Haliea sp. SAOS-164]
MSTNYAGKVAVVTGGGRGFGKAFSQALADGGASVYLVDLDSEVAEAAAAQIGANAFGIAADVTDEARMQAVCEEIAQAHGGIDILINNAGLHSHEYSRPLAEMGLQKVRRLFDVNVMGTVACTLIAAPYMAGRDGASVVNIASAAAFSGGGYGTSKLAVIGLTMTFARELAADGIRVNAIAPGVILTDTIRSEMDPGTLGRIKSMQFLSQDGEEQDIVDAMLFLTGPTAKFITGETLRVTGGFAAGI